jgi:hypothetical protein
MDIGAILIGIALLVGGAAYVARPLFERPIGDGQGRAASASPRVQLTTQRDAIYALIRELDADYATGKVNNHDYQALRKQYVAEGVSILKQLDTLTSEEGRVALEAEIEARVLALRRTQPAAESAGRQPATRFCTQCGHPAALEDRFCARCGTSLEGTASA